MLGLSPCAGAVTMCWGRHLELGSLELSCTGRTVTWCWSAFYLSPVLTSSSPICPPPCPDLAICPPPCPHPPICPPPCPHLPILSPVLTSSSPICPPPCPYLPICPLALSLSSNCLTPSVHPAPTRTSWTARAWNARARVP